MITLQIVWFYFVREGVRRGRERVRARHIFREKNVEHAPCDDGIKFFFAYPHTRAVNNRNPTILSSFASFHPYCGWRKCCTLGCRRQGGVSPSNHTRELAFLCLALPPRPRPQQGLRHRHSLLRGAPPGLHRPRASLNHRHQIGNHNDNRS